jgi:hypothetical protein
MKHMLSSSAASLLFGLRYEMFNNLFLTAKANALYHNFIGSNKNAQTPAGLLDTRLRSVIILY